MIGIVLFGLVEAANPPVPHPLLNFSGYASASTRLYPFVVSYINSLSVPEFDAFAWVVPIWGRQFTLTTYNISFEE